MKKVMIDMDDVICRGGFLDLVNEFLGTQYKYEDMKEYYVQDLVPEEKREEWSKYFYSNNIYNYTVLVEHAYETIEKLQKKYELYIATAYTFKDYPSMSDNNLRNKFIYLNKELPFINPNQYIFTTNKEIINCEIKIDDRISNLSGNAEIKLLFTAYHNKNITDEELKQKGIIRVNTWKDVEKILL